MKKFKLEKKMNDKMKILKAISEKLEDGYLENFENKVDERANKILLDAEREIDSYIAKNLSKALDKNTEKEINGEEKNYE